ncbi:Uncharacterized protein APZ42_031284, partial [Daphnia magna]
REAKKDYYEKIELHVFEFGIYGKRRGSVAAAINKVVKAAGKNNSTTSEKPLLCKASCLSLSIFIIFPGGALTVRAENGLGPTTNNTEKTSSTRVPVYVPQIQGPAHAASLSQLIQGDISVNILLNIIVSIANIFRCCFNSQTGE